MLCATHYNLRPNNKYSRPNQYTIDIFSKTLKEQFFNIEESRGAVELWQDA